MLWKCDNCGKEFELEFNIEEDNIDPPYFCPECEQLMDDAEIPEDIDYDDDYMNYGGRGDG